MKRFEFYWTDLTEECQKKLSEFLNLDEGDDNNWTYIPITTIEIEDDEEWDSDL